MRSTFSIALWTAVSSMLLVCYPAWAARSSVTERTIVAGAERDKSYPGWEGFQPFQKKPKEGEARPDTGQPPKGERQPEPEPPKVEQPQQPEGEQGTGGNSGMEGDENP